MVRFVEFDAFWCYDDAQDTSVWQKVALNPEHVIRVIEQPARGAAPGTVQIEYFAGKFTGQFFTLDGYAKVMDKLRGETSKPQGGK